MNETHYLQDRKRPPPGTGTRRGGYWALGGHWALIPGCYSDGVLSYPDYLKSPPLVRINTLQRVGLESEKILLEKYETFDVFADKR